MEKAHLAVSQEEYTRLGLTKKIEMFEDGIRTTGKKGEFEWWYYDAKMDDGSTLVLTFFLNDATDAKGGFHPSIKIELTYPDGTEIKDRVYFDPNDCSFSKEKCDVRMNENFFLGDLRNYHIYVKTKKIETDITLTGNTPAWRSETGHIYFGDQKYFAWLPSVPEGSTKAAITINGETTTFTGTGYHDHNWGNAPMMEVLHHWYWGRAKIGPYNVISCYITSTKHYNYEHLPIFMLAKDGELIGDHLPYLSYEQSEPAFDEKTKKHYHKKLVYRYDDGNTCYLITYKVAQTIASFSLLDDGQKKTSRVQQALLKVMGLAPTYDRFNGEAKIEKIVNGKTVETYSNPATWEMMYFALDRNV